MFGVKTRLRNYLTQIRPWAMGKNDRGWESTDFDSAEVKEARLAADHIIMPLMMPNVSAFDRLFLTKEQHKQLLNFEHAASNFNAILARLNEDKYADSDLRYKYIRMLHVGAIGNAWSPGLFTAYVDLLASLR